MRHLETVKKPITTGFSGIIEAYNGAAPAVLEAPRGQSRKGLVPVNPHDTPYPIHRKNDQRVLRMFARYQDGLSLSQVASEFGVTRQSVFKMFRRRGMPMRTPSQRESIEFNGELYSWRDCGYFGKTRGDRNYLHRDIWEFHNGAIPDGFDVHHIDMDPTNNDISNLECLPKDEHTRRHYQERRAA